MINVISLVLTLLEGVLTSATASKLPGEIIDSVQAAITALQKVRDTDVTYSQLESLRVTPKW